MQEYVDPFTLQALQNNMIQWKKDIIKCFEQKQQQTTGIPGAFASQCQNILNQVNNACQLYKNGLVKYQTQPTKILLISWQVLNFVMVSIDQSVINDFFKILDKCKQTLASLINYTCLFKLQSVLQKQQKFHRNQMKCMLIFVFNLYKKQYEKPQLLFITLKYLLIFETRHQIEQQQFLTEQEDQWNIYILILSFNTSFSYIEFLGLLQQNIEKTQFEILFKKFLELITNSLAEAISRRNTTQLVQSYQCKIADIKEMYSNQNNQMQIKIKPNNLQSLLQLFKKHILNFRENLSEYLKGNSSNYNDQSLMVLIDIFGQLTFLGGYNSQLQDIVLLFIEADLLMLFQICFNLYILTRKINSNIKLQNQGQSFQQNAIKNICSLLDIDEQSINLLMIPKPPNSILPLILKLLSNLVHINRKAQDYFQKQEKYFNIVLNLTHNTPEQMTMREWSIVFIRHVSECSLKLRQILAKSKIDINVDSKKIEELSPYLDTVKL